MNVNLGTTGRLSRRTLLKGSATTAGALGLLSVAGSGTALAAHLHAASSAGGALSTTNTTLTTTPLQKLTASDGAADDNFGFAVSVSADETTAIVGAPHDDDDGNSSGAVYLYDLTTTPPTEAKLTATDAADGEQFGTAVSLNADGTTALIGAIGDAHTVPGVGAAYVYDLTTVPPTETKLTATDAAIHDFFGHVVSVSADGTTALVGAYKDDDGGNSSGAAYVYDLTTTPPTETKLTATDAATGDQFGFTVSIDADGTTALIGANNEDDGGPNSGAAYLYDLTTTPPTETKLTATDAAASDLFGYAVSISADATVALVGAIYDDDGGPNSGAAYLYDLTQNPTTQTKLIATDAAAGAFFGREVSVSSDGTAALIGAPGDEHAGAHTGSAYIYDLTSSPPTETRLAAADSSAGATFAYSVSVSENGTTAFMGAPYTNEDGDSPGAAYLYLGTGPVTSDVGVSPEPVGTGARFDITSLVEEPTGIASVVSAGYEIRDTSASIVVSGSMSADDGAFDEAAEAVSATADGLPAGTYEVCVTGTNSRGIVGPETCVTFEVRESTSGFVIGGGWLESTPGAYLSNPTAAGKATFNVTAKTTPRSSTLRGHVMYRLKACNLAFKSRTLSALIVTDTQAQLSGTGTLNRTIGYRFTLTVTDGDLASPQAPDHVHMRIWNPQDVLIYDNDTSTELGRGNISLKTR